MTNMINLKINNIPVTVEQDTTIFQAAKKLNIRIPTLCYHEDLCVAGNCRVCVVEQIGNKNLPASCCTPVTQGMEILTNSRKVRNARKTIIKLLLSEHDADCTKCYKNGNCELQDLAKEYCPEETEFYIDLLKDKVFTIDMASPSIIKDDSKCIKCQRCVRTCAEIQGVSALTAAFKGADIKISTFFEKPISEVVCTNCGQCINRCPTGALVEKRYINEVWNAIDDTTKHVVVQTAPATRIALGEELGYEPGQRVTGKMVTALKQLGFDSVLDTDFTADLTIMEEGTELLTRLKRALVDKDTTVALPMTTSCSPGWIKFCEHAFPEFLPNISTCKSPQQMFGPLSKTYYAEKKNIDPKDVVCVSIMPCTAKKFESDRPEMTDSGYKDVDYVLTTRELALMIKQAGIDFLKLEDSKYDPLMGASTGAAAIFGATGGVMEAALRTAYEIATGREVPFKNLNIMPVRGMDGVKEAKVLFEDCLPDWSFLNGVELSVVIAHGLANARQVLQSVKDGKANYHFIEIMACPGGCLGGGGQPIPTSPEIRQKRTQATYEEDMNMPIRKSHNNPEIKQIYEDYLEKPLGHKSHHLLHTKYSKREKY